MPRKAKCFKQPVTNTPQNWRTSLHQTKITPSGNHSYLWPAGPKVLEEASKKNTPTLLFRRETHKEESKRSKSDPAMKILRLKTKSPSRLAGDHENANVWIFLFVRAPCWLAFKVQMVSSEKEIEYKLTPTNCLHFIEPLSIYRQ